VYAGRPGAIVIAVGRISRIGMLLAVGVLALAAQPALGANRTLAKFTWSFRAHIRHDWSVTSSAPCGRSATGYIESSFKGQGRGLFKVTASPYGVFYDYDPQTRLTGTVTESHSPGAQNPPEDPLIPCPKNTQTLDCGTRPVKQGFGWLQPAPTNARKLLFSATDIGNAFDGTCNLSLFNDWGRVGNRELGAMRIRLPAPAALAHARGSVGRSAHKTNTIGRDHQVRDVTVTLKRVG
jgi:hypothetical protein